MAKVSVLENAETTSILSIAYDKIIEHLTSPDVDKKLGFQRGESHDNFTWVSRNYLNFTKLGLLPKYTIGGCHKRTSHSAVFHNLLCVLGDCRNHMINQSIIE